MEINIKLVNKPSDATQVFTSHPLKIRAKDNSEHYKFNFGVYNHLDKNGADRCFPTIASTDSNSDIPLSSYGYLILEIELKLFSPKLDPGFEDVKAIQEANKIMFAYKLQADLDTLLHNPMENCKTKATIISKDGVKFSVNREIFSARSPVFEKTFGTRMKESKTGIIEIPDIGSKVISLLLKFIYIGNLHPDWKKEETLPDFVYAAHKYELTDLVEFMDKILGGVCTKDNCVEMLTLTMKLSLKTAERELLEKIKKYILKTEDFILLANQLLSTDCQREEEDE